MCKADMVPQICTGRQVSTPPCHVQAVTCLAVTPYHVLSASDDSNINVWSLSRMLELDAPTEHEPDLTLSNHRGAITSLVVGPGTNPETSICVSASRDKSCIIWNYQSGQVLRTLLFPTAPLCVRLDPTARALFVSSEDGGLYLIELFGDKPLLGSRSAELASIVVQVGAPLGVSDADAGPPCCLALTYDGTSILSGHTRGKILRWSPADNAHPTELADLNASVTNLVFVPPISAEKPTRCLSIVKPSQAQRQYTFTAQLATDLTQDTRFSLMLNNKGFSAQSLEEAILSLTTPPSDDSSDPELQRQDTDFRNIINSEKVLQKCTISS